MWGTPPAPKPVPPSELAADTFPSRNGDAFTQRVRDALADGYMGAFANDVQVSVRQAFRDHLMDRVTIPFVDRRGHWATLAGFRQKDGTIRWDFIQGGVALEGYSTADLVRFLRTA